MMEKKIHYCWFGKKKKPYYVVSCIRSWEKFFPDWEIIEWNESNIDIEHSCNYVKEAYKHKAWAFVSDYVRFKVLFDYGGLYFDTDVKVFKKFDLLVSIPFLAMEKDGMIAPGLVCGFDKHDFFCETMIDYYKNSFYKNNDGSQKTICQVATSLFLKKGYVIADKTQKIGEYTIYSSEYFCPIDYRTHKKEITSNTYTIHLYKSSWITKKRKFINRFSNFLNHAIGKKNKEKLLSLRNKNRH